tara:strand:- start:420 stop:575 length:156 start_codon:yes stop_codon:yes gene_type:complete
VELHFGERVNKTILFNDFKQMIASRPKTNKKANFDLGELIGQFLFDFYARH